MSYQNNTVTLTGNIAAEPVTGISKNGVSYARLTIYTTERYLDKKGDQWKSKQSISHKLIAYSPKIIATLKFFSVGARIQIKGSLGYKYHEVTFDNGEKGKIKSANIIVTNVEPAALPVSNKSVLNETTENINDTQQTVS